MKTILKIILEFAFIFFYFYLLMGVCRQYGFDTHLPLLRMCNVDKIVGFSLVSSQIALLMQPRMKRLKVFLGLQRLNLGLV